MENTSIVKAEHGYVALVKEGKRISRIAPIIAWRIDYTSKRAVVSGITINGSLEDASNFFGYETPKMAVICPDGTRFPGLDSANLDLHSDENGQEIST